MNKLSFNFKGHVFSYVINIKRLYLEVALWYACLTISLFPGSQQIGLETIYTDTFPLITNIEDKFLCEVCNRSYKNKGDLQRHVRIECGREPRFQCPFCDLCVKYKYVLSTHIKRKHSNDNYLHFSWRCCDL